MKKFKNTLGMMSVLVILIVFASCSSKSKGDGYIPPPDPTPTPTPKVEIKSFTPTDSPINFVYSGTPNQGVIFSWETVNASTITFNGETVSPTGSKTVIPVVGSSIATITVTDASGKITKQDKSVITIVDAGLAKFTGTSESGFSWVVDSVWSSSGSYTLEPFEYDDIFTFYPKARFKYDPGLINPSGAPGVTEDEFTYDPIGNTLHMPMYQVQPKWSLDFPSPNIMVQTNVKNGITYKRYYHRV